MSHEDTISLIHRIAEACHEATRALFPAKGLTTWLDSPPETIRAVLRAVEVRLGNPYDVPQGIEQRLFFAIVDIMRPDEPLCLALMTAAPESVED